MHRRFQKYFVLLLVVANIWIGKKCQGKSRSVAHASLRKFGGSLQKSHPKTARTLSSNKALHLVMKSKQDWGVNSMLHSQHIQKIHRLIHEKARSLTLISWGRDDNHVIRYMKKNEKQAIPA